MGISTFQCNRERLATNRSTKRKRAAALAAALAAAVTVQQRFHSSFIKIPKNNSKLTGQQWLDELLSGHPQRFYDSMGMNKHVFRALLGELIKIGLHDTRYVTAEEQLAIFLYLAVTGLAQRHLEERFQRSPDTISKCVTAICHKLELIYCRAIHRILNLLTSEAFYNSYVKLPTADTPLASEIRDDPKLYPFFKDCQGSIDGTHLDAFVPDDAVARYCNRKGRLSQNVLAACSQDMRFIYVLSGWEGSAADGHIFEDARQHDLAIPAGKYFLADAGFSTCDNLMVPYRGERYHLKEWGRVGLRWVIFGICYKLRYS